MKKLRMKQKTKKNLKKVLIGVACVGGVALLASGTKVLMDYNESDVKTIHPTFAIGGLDSNGKYEESETTLYTKEAFECKGLTITLDFENDITYQVFFYDEDGKFVSSSDVLDEKYNDEIPTGATHARVEVTPQWTDVEEDDQKLDWFDIRTYSKQLTIEVDKVQEEKEDTEATA